MQDPSEDLAFQHPALASRLLLLLYENQSSFFSPHKITKVNKKKTTRASNENKGSPLSEKFRNTVSVFLSMYLSVTIVSVSIFIALGNGNCSFYI